MPSAEWPQATSRRILAAPGSMKASVPGRRPRRPMSETEFLQGLGHPHAEADVTVPRQGEARLCDIVHQAGDGDRSARQPHVDIDVIACNRGDDRVTAGHLAAVLEYMLCDALQLVVLQRLHPVELVGLQELRGVRKRQRKAPRAAVEAIRIALAFDQAGHEKYQSEWNRCSADHINR